MNKEANTQAAIDELNDVLRVLFPIVPHKSHIILAARNQRLWRESQHPRALKSKGHFLADPYFRENEADLHGAEEETETGAEEPRGRFGFHGRQQHHTLSELFRPGNDFDRSALIEPPTHQEIPSATAISNSRSRVLEQQEMMMSPESSVLGSSSSASAKAADVAREGEILSIVTQVRQTEQQEQQPSANENRPGRPRPPPPALPHFIMRGSKLPVSGKATKNQEEGTKSQIVRLPVKPELTTPSLGKRGPECMRRCIMQGLLHPVQCHSLC